jgi:flagellar biosynthetic protein FliR
MTITILSLDEVFRFLFLLTRLSAMVLPLPFLGSRIVPAQLKVVFLVVLSFGLYPAIRMQKVPLPSGPGHLGLLLLGELCIGLLIGFVAQVMFVGIQLSGELINQQMGLSMASILDPQNTQQISIISNFQYVLAALLFFSGPGYHWFIYAMAESLHVIPLLEFTAAETVLTFLVGLLGKTCITAVKIAAPLVVILILTNIAMGLVARLVPQMNVFMLSFPVTLGVGLVALGLTLPSFLVVVRDLFTRLGGDLFALLRLLGGG